MAPFAPSRGPMPRPNGTLAFTLLAATALAQSPYARDGERDTDVRRKTDWIIVEHDVFEIHIPNEELLPVAREAAAWLEDARARIEKQVDFRTRAPVRVILYASRHQARQSPLVQDVPSELGALVSEGQRRRIVLPVPASRRAFRRTLEHQLAALMMEQHHLGATPLKRSILEFKTIFYPSWVLDGVAASLSTPMEPYERMFVTDAALDRNLPELSAMHGRKPLGSHELARHLAHSRLAVEWVATKTPRGSVKRFFRVFDSDLPFPPARLIRRVADMSYNDIEDSVKAYLEGEARTWAEGRTEPEAWSRRVRDRDSYYLRFELGATWSPDGRRVAFFQDDSGTWNITIADAAGASEERVIPALSVLVRSGVDSVVPRERGLSWSPDGATLAFVGDHKGRAWLCLKKIDGDLRRVSLPFHDISQPSWSPDGKRLAIVGFRAGRSDLYEVEADTLAVERLTKDDDAESDPAWGPDGRIAFARETCGQTDLWIVSGGVETRLTDTCGNEIQPAWNADGSLLAFAGDGGGSFDLYTIDPASRAVVRLTASRGGAFAPSWKPGGREILFTSFRHGRFAARIMTPAPAGDVPPEDALRAAAAKAFICREAEGCTVRPYSTQIEIETILPTGATLSDLFRYHEFKTDVDVSLRTSGSRAGGKFTYENHTFRPDLQISVYGYKRTGDRNESRYGLEAGLTYPVDRWIRLGLSAFGERFRDDLVEIGPTSGIRSGFRVGLSRKDVIKRRGDPIAGTYLTLGAEILLPQMGSDLSRVTYTGEARTYFELFEDHVLAFRLRFAKTFGRDADEIDVDDYVRGYGSTDRPGTDLWAASVEFRFPIHRDIDFVFPGQIAVLKDVRGVLFFDIAVLSAEGDLGAILVDPVYEEWHHAAGAGLRLDFFIFTEAHIPVTFSISHATDGTDEAPDGFSFGVTFDVEF
jgi:hypothetical protein